MRRGYFLDGKTLTAVLFLTVVLGLDTKEFQKSLPAKIVWAVPGRNAELPCDITPALPGDNVTMIFWFRGSMPMPLYTLDARKGALDVAAHLAMSDDLGSRSVFVTEGEPSQARLRIQGVKLQDQGVFRCRVDFVNSPTRNFQINLTLVVQPSAPRIFDAEGKEIRISQPAGPFLEGDELFLSCQVTGGNPKPSLTWWLNDTILDSVIDSSRASSTTVNQLVVKKTQRVYKGAKLECRATSSDNAGYIARKVPLTIFLRPSKVKIVSPNDLMSMGRPSSVRCETSGSYPPAKLTWLLDGRAIRSAVVTEEVTESFTVSILSLSVNVEDDGKELVCRADNPHFPGGTAEDSRKIHVAYPPKLSVVKMDAPPVENGGKGATVGEGEEVVLKCETTARPPAEHWSWYFEGHLLPYNETAGIMPDGQNLVLRNLRYKLGGHYVCAAVNSEGETYSAPYELKIEYAPRCSKGYESTKIGALPFETLMVECHVDAIPSVSKFSWTYNTSKGVFAVQGSKMENLGNKSVLHFTPESDEVESLACWATNEIGRQQEPCLFHIVTAEAPESPRSCLVREASRGLEVSCLAGSDGGLRQSFVLEVADVATATPPEGVATTLNDQGEIPSPKYRVLGDRPVFRLHSLEPGKDYQFSVYAENARGKSNPPVILPNVRVTSPTTTLPNYQEEAPDVLIYSTTQRSTPPPANSNLTAIIIAAAVAAVLLILTITIVAAVVSCRRPRQIVRMRRKKIKSPEECELSEDGFGEGFQRRSAQYRASMYGECEERIARMVEQPDLIMPPVSISQNDLDF